MGLRQSDSLSLGDIINRGDLELSGVEHCTEDAQKIVKKKTTAQRRHYWISYICIKLQVCATFEETLVG